METKLFSVQDRVKLLVLMRFLYELSTSYLSFKITQRMWIKYCEVRGLYKKNGILDSNGSQSPVLEAKIEFYQIS